MFSCGVCVVCSLLTAVCVRTWMGEMQSPILNPALAARKVVQYQFT